MCRHIAYVGDRIALRELLLDAPHALSTQARAPLHQTFGDSNPHGWGVAWYPASGATPNRHRSTVAIWDDPEVASSFATVEAHAALAAARLASPGSEISLAQNAPFVTERWACSFNGEVEGWYDNGVGEALRARVSDRRRRSIEGATDGETLFALVLDRVDRGATLTDALGDTIELVSPGTDARVNLLVTDGQEMAATAIGNSLFVCSDGDGTTLASEPLDDDGWRRIGDRRLVSVGAHGSTETTI